MMTANGYITTVSAEAFRTQGRGGRGVAGTKLKDEDDVPPDCGVDLDLVAFARAQQGAAPPTDDLVVDEASAPELVELHAWLDRHLPPPTA